MDGSSFRSFIAFERASRTVCPGRTWTIVRCSLGKYARTTDLSGDRGGGGKPSPVVSPVVDNGGPGAPTSPKDGLKCEGTSTASAAFEESSCCRSPGLCRPLVFREAASRSITSCSSALNSCSLLVSSLYSCMNFLKEKQSDSANFSKNNTHW